MNLRAGPSPGPRIMLPGNSWYLFPRQLYLISSPVTVLAIYCLNYSINFIPVLASSLPCSPNKLCCATSPKTHIPAAPCFLACLYSTLIRPLACSESELTSETMNTSIYFGRTPWTENWPIARLLSTHDSTTQTNMDTHQ